MFTRTRGPTSSSLGWRSMRPLVVAALCAAFVATAPTTAQAQTISDPDAAGDMADNPYAGSVVPVPHRRLNDVTNTTLTHGANRVAVRVEYVNLNTKAHERPQLWIDVNTPNWGRRYVELDAWRNDWSGKAQMYNGRYKPFGCAVGHSIDYTANVMTVSFPRRCVSNPRWVRFQVGVLVDDGDSYFMDDALLDRAMTDYDEILVRSERVYSGAAN